MTTPNPTVTEGIDWEQVHQRLARINTAIDEALVLSPERARAVMEERSRTLARVPPRTPNAAEVIEVTTFSLANERYAIETRYIREVACLSDITLLPEAPDFLAGLVNLRGEVLAVFDLRKFFGVSEREMTKLSRVLVLGSERVEFGVLADIVHEVQTLRIDEVYESSGTVAEVGREYVHGVTADALIVLDGSILLSDVRLFIDQVEEAGP